MNQNVSLHSFALYEYQNSRFQFDAEAVDKQRGVPTDNFHLSMKLNITDLDN